MTEAKRHAGEKAIDYVEDGMIVGVGTGSTVAFFIDALAPHEAPHRRARCRARSRARNGCAAHGIEVLDLNATGPLSLYVDGADECDPHKRLIKGGGAALTREKIIAEASAKFVCIIDSGQAGRRARAVSRCRSKSSRWRAAWSRAKSWRRPAASRSGAKASSPTTATGSSTCTAAHHRSGGDGSGIEPDPRRGQRAACSRGARPTS